VWGVVIVRLVVILIVQVQWRVALLNCGNKGRHINL